MDIRVLIADPERELLDAYRDYLIGQGFDVETASSGRDCVNKLRSIRPDCLVLEPDMADGWGDRILEAACAERPAIPVLVLSRQDAGPVDHRVCKFHVKPVSMIELAGSIRKAAAQGEADIHQTF